jgi:hypothetical protein
MLFRVLADLVVLTHLAFILFVVGGGLLALRWRWVPWVQVPAALWGAVIEVCGWICPLTPLENGLRARAGEAGYAGGFVEHYVLPVVYPGALTRGVQVVLAVVVVVANGVIYLWIWRRAGRRRQTSWTGG